jgi:hypothetical protein
MPAAHAHIGTDSTAGTSPKAVRTSSALPAWHTQGRPAKPWPVARTDTQGTVTSGDATTPQARPSALVLRGEAVSEDSLQHDEALVTRPLARIGAAATSCQ